MRQSFTTAREAAISTNLERRSLLREVNERIRDANDAFRVGQDPEVVEFFCECGDADCLQRLVVAPNVYESVREVDGYFLVTPAHQGPGSVVATDEAYCIVSLHGNGAPCP